MPEDPYALFDVRYFPPPALNQDSDGRKGDSSESGGYWHPPEDPDLHVNEFYCVRHDCVMKPVDLHKEAVCKKNDWPFHGACVWQYHNRYGVMTITEGMVAYIVRSKNAQEPV